MKKSFLSAFVALVAAACTSPTSPSPDASASVSAPGGEGSVGASAVTVERLRLRRANGPDIVTNLVSGQVISVPTNENLDIWAEVRRLETDRARLLVDWGNGNQDFAGCGSCRLENTYARAGRYNVSARVIDLNAPSGAAPLTEVNVVLEAVNPSPVLPCVATVTTFVGSLNGTSNASVFEIDTATALPLLGWTNVSGAGQIWDLASNGALFGATQWGNYEIQHDTGVAILPDTKYTLQFDMGYMAAITGGNSGFRYQLGTVSAGVFTGLGTPATGTVPYLGGFNGGVVSATGLQVVQTGSSVPSGTLALRWAQTSSLGAGFSDHFGIDRVTLSATRCAQ